MPLPCRDARRTIRPYREKKRDQRQFCPRDRTILHADEAIVDARPLIAEVHMFRLSLAGIPDRS
jgi:hypothetical protein